MAPWQPTLDALDKLLSGFRLMPLPFGKQRRALSLLADLVEFAAFDGWSAMIDEELPKAAREIGGQSTGPLELWCMAVTLWNQRREREQAHEDAAR